MYYLYSITNKINNKTYIGQTINPENRKEEHLSCGDRSNFRLRKDIKKYGRENFEFEIIDDTENAIEINFMESNLIEENGDKIYNIHPGGQLISNFDHYICSECNDDVEMKDVCLTDKTGMLYFNIGFDTTEINVITDSSDMNVCNVLLLCRSCKLSDKLYLKRKSYKRSKNLTANAFMDLIFTYNVPDNLIDKLMLVNGKLNPRMSYAFFTKRVGWK